MNAHESELIKRFKLTDEQAELYRWLKSQDINTDENTLCYWTKKYSIKRIKEVIYFAKERIEKGQEIKNMGGWINNFLKREYGVINDVSRSNLAYLKDFIEEKKWKDISIYEKYIRDHVSGDDLPLTLERSEFQRSLDALWRKSQLYK